MRERRRPPTPLRSSARLSSFAPAKMSARSVARRDEADPSPPSGRAVDVQAAAEQRQPLADAEQPPAHLAGLRSIVESRRLEPNPLIRHGDAQLIVGVERQRQRDAIRLRVLDRVEEQLSDRLEEQRADILPRGICARVGVDLDTQLVLVVRPVRQPRQGGGQSGTLQHGRKQLHVQRPRDGDRFVELLLRLCQQLARRSSNLGLPLQLLFEVQRHDDQELLEPIVQRPGDLLARMVLGERQVPRHPTQLRRPVFQFGRALLKGHRGTLAFGDVGHERECASAARRRNVIDGDFDRKRGSVLARADEVEAARRVRAVAKDRWDQALDRLADQLVGGPAEHHLDRTIRKDEHPTRVRRNDALRGGLEQRSQRAIVFLVATRLESIFNPAALGDVQLESSEPRDAGRSRRDRLAPDSASSARRHQGAAHGRCDPTYPSSAEPLRVCGASADGLRRAHARATSRIMAVLPA